MSQEITQCENCKEQKNINVFEGIMADKDYRAVIYQKKLCSQCFDREAYFYARAMSRVENPVF